MEWAEHRDSPPPSELQPRAWDTWLQGSEQADDQTQEVPRADDQPPSPKSSDSPSNDSGGLPDGLPEDSSFDVAAWTHRGDLLAEYPLDDESAALASKVGRDLAEVVPQNWGELDEVQRMRTADAIYWTIKDDLAPNAGAPMPEGHDVPPEEMGRTMGQDVYFNRNLLSESQPNDLVMTLVHEYRHAWQNDVATGNIEHPLGDVGRAQIVSALESYDDDIFQDYSYQRNLLEMDAERFALDACRSLTDERDFRRKARR